MDHPDLRPGLDKLIQGPTSTKTKGTKPHGTKVLEAGEDTVWVDEETGTEHSVRSIPTLMDRLVDDLAAGISTASKRNVVASSEPPAAQGAATAAGYPEGAYWTTVELVAGEPVERSRWIARAGTWEQVGLDASTLVMGKIDAGLIDTVALAARLVTGGLIRTGATGQRVELTSDGLVLWLVDEDGQEYRGVQIGPTGATLITVGETTITPASVTAPEAAFESLAVGGQDLGQVIDGRIAARGSQLVAIGGAGLAGGNIDANASTETGIFDVILPRLIKDAWYRVEVTLVTYPSGQEVETQVRLRYSPAAQGVMTNSPLIGERPVGMVRADVWDQKQATLWVRGSQLGLMAEGESARLLLTVEGKGRALKIDANTTMAVYLDAIPAIPFSSTINRGGAPLAGQTTATPQQASTSVQTYTKEWKATGSELYYSAANRRTYESTDVIQGSWDGSSANRRHGLWQFPDMTADLAGATITGVSIWAKCTYLPSGTPGTAHFYAHNGTNSAGVKLLDEPFKKGEPRLLQVPPQYWDGIKNGSIRGFMAYTASNSTGEYMRFAGGANSAAIYVSYTK